MGGLVRAPGNWFSRSRGLGPWTGTFESGMGGRKVPGGTHDILLVSK